MSARRALRRVSLAGLVVVLARGPAPSSGQVVTRGRQQHQSTTTAPASCSSFSRPRASLGRCRSRAPPREADADTAALQAVNADVALWSTDRRRSLR